MPKTLADLYKPYDFNLKDADGPGCGVPEHGPECLCDVDLEAHPVPQGTTPVMPYAATATQACMDRGIEPHPLAVVAEILGLYEAARAAGASLRATPEEVEELCAEYRSLGNAPARFARHSVLLRMVQTGLSLRACATLIGCPEREVAEQFSLRSTDPDKVLAAAEAMHRGVDSFYQLASELDMPHQAVCELARVLGYQSTAQSRIAAGGGRVYSAEQYETVRRMRAEGASYGEIAKATGMKRSAVSMWCNRNKVA